MSRHEPRQAVARTFGATDIIATLTRDPVLVATFKSTGEVTTGSKVLLAIKDSEQKTGVYAAPAGCDYDVQANTPLGQECKAKTLQGFYIRGFTVDIVAVAFQAGNTAFMRQQAKLLWHNDSLEVGAARGALDDCARPLELEVDGGVDAETAPRAVSAGATVLVAGTAAFRGGPASYAANIRALRGEG